MGDISTTVQSLMTTDNELNGHEVGKKGRIQ
jgi:hypothetical protein